MRHILIVVEPASTPRYAFPLYALGSVLSTIALAWRSLKALYASAFSKSGDSWLKFPLPLYAVMREIISSIVSLVVVGERAAPSAT